MTKEKMNIFEKIMTARLQFLKSNPTKSGYNKFQNFKYFELEDIVPVAIKICNDLGLYTQINITEGKAVMTVVNMENVQEQLEFKIDAPMVRENDFNKMLQDVGRSETYLRRYLYLLFLDITENDTVDGADQNQTSKPMGNGFKKANELKHKPKPNARVKAERIIKELEKSDEKPTIEKAKKILGLNTFNGVYTIEESNLIFKELEVLLNGTGS